MDDMTPALALIAPLPAAPLPQAASVLAQPAGKASEADKASISHAESHAASTNDRANNGKMDAGENSFSRLLGRHAPQPSSAPSAKLPASSGASAPAAGGEASPNATPPASAAAQTSSGSGASSGSGSSTVASLLLVQIQNPAIAPVATAQNTGVTSPEASSASGASTPAQASSASGASYSSSTLADVQKLLQQLEQLTAQTPASASTSSGSGSATPAQAHAPSSGSGVSGPADDSLAQLVAQIAALLPQAAPQQPAASAFSGAQDASAVSSGSGSSGLSAGLLAQLTRALGQKLSAANGSNNAAGSASASSGSGASDAADSSFAAQLSALEQSGGAKDALQSALAKVGDLLAATPGSKQTDTNSSSSEADAANTNGAGAAVAAPPASLQSTPDSGFAKLVTAPSGGQPADQVLVQIKNAVADGASSIKIQLSPESLGKVVVQLTTTSDGKTGITITADNRQTLSLLQNEARALEANLRDIGMKTQSGGLSFNLSGQQQQQQQPGKQSGYTQVGNPASDADADYAGTVTKVYSLAAQQGLDIRV